jgi:hypothetical protein
MTKPSISPSVGGQRARGVRAISPRAAASCTHHWLIETPNGEFSRGRCKKCGAKKQFRNANVLDVTGIPYGEGLGIHRNGRNRDRMQTCSVCCAQFTERGMSTHRSKKHPEVGR